MPLELFCIMVLGISIALVRLSSLFAASQYEGGGPWEFRFHWVVFWGLLSGGVFIWPFPWFAILLFRVLGGEGARLTRGNGVFLLVLHLLAIATGFISIVLASFIVICGIIPFIFFSG